MNIVELGMWGPKHIIGGRQKWGEALTKEELESILDAHAIWRKHGGDGQPVLIGADLEGADLRDKDLACVIFMGANLKSADLEGANLSFTDFVGADLENANLKDAVLTHTDLRGADFTGAMLYETDFEGAILE